MVWRKTITSLKIIIPFALVLLVLPMQIRLNVAHLLISGLLIVLLAFIVWNTFTVPEPMEATVELRGKSYHFPDLPDHFTLDLDKDSPVLRLSKVEDNLSMVHFSLWTKKKPHFKVVLCSSHGTILFEEKNLEIGKTVSIPVEALKAAGVRAEDMPVNIQVREGSGV